ncbi:MULTISPECIES: methylated-DNA--[protein]-cysteine S-methyltransferase [Bacillus]|jgi:methylated-DNA-[protein]-cysteine S-methyltransferase|uniref:methylated-DNA--[protein]-cysteine S-methyltransferase n=1 Tax=Bacillus TaxID=1386 RepID=UPI00065E587A|nr:methylated-DNA--[protein]-cysteine S-methyltransferase [Bacillus smithii]AKP46637.1 Methylated-DNA--protein-cysteine methyltransferase [Bacillus smithii]MED0660238.1 methylated-DNA--[protein]-cysteine S-methyltransferase [Bacillus smithii]MED1419613.1 methylated-DNA--[protein]-cysteine S-methyltransferase [Bacillus smithii]MED1455979.1 methylated-DNA--[protein]-cysteine S-methyltransferase [Bacillus smithii]MED4882370.1 methylated-DNA--[protein]-cysteine S-methyltransferase [Bacillus smithi
MKLFLTMNSPIGNLTIVSSRERIIGLEFGEKAENEEIKKAEKDALLLEARGQLLEYFDGKRKVFQLPIFLKGTEFQLKVWNELLHIPYGETRSYQEIAAAIGNKNAVRAVGQANKANPMPIIIPCHRVIGKNNQLIGYAGKQIDKKAILLELEKTSLFMMV